MLISSETAAHLLDAAICAVRDRPDTFYEVLDQMPAAIYVTDNAGTITYFNRACVDLAGRTPTLGSDKWCVTWKLYTLDGEFLPHDECPMAIAIREKREIRNVEAIAERPDGTRLKFVPFPTPLFGPDGDITGAVNLLVDVTRERKPDYLREQAERCRRLAKGVLDRGVAETLFLMAAKYDEQALKQARHAKGE